MAPNRDAQPLDEKLLALDRPSGADERKHNEALFAKIERRLRREKIVGGAIYLVLFLLAFLAFLQADRTQNLAHAAAWGTVSLHILLWFLVYMLRVVYCLVGQVADGDPAAEPDRQWERRECFISDLAIVVFALSTALVCRSFWTADSLRAVQAVSRILWAPVFFLFWYPFGTASLVGRLWLRYKKTQLLNAQPPEPRRTDP